MSFPFDSWNETHTDGYNLYVVAEMVGSILGTCHTSPQQTMNLGAIGLGCGWGPPGTRICHGVTGVVSNCLLVFECSVQETG